MDIFAAEAIEYAKDLELPPKKTRGWVHEVEVPLRKGESLGFDSGHDGAGGRVEFNVHSHQGPEVTYHVKRSEAKVAGTFTAPWDGKFYMMWENVSDAPVRVRVRANREGYP